MNQETVVSFDEAGDEQDRLALGAICRDLAGSRNAIEKLALLVGYVRDDADGRAAARVDGLIGELLGSERVLAELVEPHPYLGVVLRRTLDLALSDRGAVPAAADGPASDLNRLLVAGRLPLARVVLLDRVREQLGAPLPLGSGRREEEIRLFQELLAMLVTPGGVVGQAGMAEALVARYARRLDQDGGGPEGGGAIRPALQGVTEALPNLFSRLHFLAALAASETGRRAIHELALQVDTLAHNQTLIESAVFRPFDPPALRLAFDRAVEAFEKAGLPMDIEARLRNRITGLLDGFVTRGKFLELMDAAEPSVSRRSQGLAAVVTAGLVTEFGGKPLIEHHIARLPACPGAGAGAEPGQGPDPDPDPLRLAPVHPHPADDIRLNSRFGRYRCPYCFETKSGGTLCLVCGYDEEEGARPGVHLAAGTVLQGRYVVGRLIGQGGFGATYLGWDERLQAKVAVKEYFPVSLAGRVSGSASLRPHARTLVAPFRDGIVKFIEEARILARLRHVREIVEVLDYFEANGSAYMVMELLVGRTLQRHLLEEGGSLDYRRALGLILPVAKAVHDVHRLGLVHRDISPDNIFLQDHDGAKLLDFGAARHYVGEVTGALTVVLKRGYAPPEQYVRDGQQGPWTDVYALCATFYCAITGRPPPESVTRRETETLVRPSTLGIPLPAAVEEALLAGLALDWQDRPRDMKTLLQAFNRALS